MSAAAYLPFDEPAPHSSPAGRVQFIVIPPFVARRTDLGWDEKALVALVRFAVGQNAWAWWTHAQYAGELGVSRQKVQRMCARLVERGFLCAALDERRRWLNYQLGAKLLEPVEESVENQGGGCSDLSNGCPELSNGCSPGEHKKKQEKEQEFPVLEKDSCSSFQKRLPFGEKKRPGRERLAQPPAEALLEVCEQRIQNTEKRREVTRCPCGFKGRGLVLDARGDLLRIEACPKCHRRGYDYTQDARAG